MWNRIILIAVGILFLVALIIFKIQINNLIDLEMKASSGASCILSTGECIHQQSNLPVYIGISVVFIIFSLGIYLIFFEKSQEIIKKNQEELIKTLGETKKSQDKDEKFKYLLKGLDENEQKALNAVREQDGITQATLRIRVNMSKTMLSFVLSSLEKKNLIKKVPKGKTNQIYLKFS